jgi:hypothetical protein
MSRKPAGVQTGLKNPPKPHRDSGGAPARIPYGAVQTMGDIHANTPSVLGSDDYVERLNGSIKPDRINAKALSVDAEEAGTGKG